MTSSLWIGILLFGAFFLWAYRFSLLQSQVPRRRWLLLLLIRFAFVLLLFWLLTNPTRNNQIEQPEQVYFPIIMDDSASMQLPGAGGMDTVRAVEARELIMGQNGLAESLRARGFEAPVLALSDFSILENDNDYKPNVETTRLADAFARVAGLWKPEELAAIMLVSDGCDHGPEPGDALGRLNTPLLAIGMGLETLPLDVELAQLALPHRTFEHESFIASVRIRRQGEVGDSVDGELLIYDRAEDSTETVDFTATFNGSDEMVEKSLNIVLHKEGSYDITARMKDLVGENISANNYKSRSIQVEKARLRVLLTAETLDWEVSFMRRQLLLSPRIELTTLQPVVLGAALIDPNAQEPASADAPYLLLSEDETAGVTREFVSLNGLVERLASWDVVVLFRPGEMITAELATRLKEQTKKGATLVVLGFDSANPVGAENLSGCLPAKFLPARLNASEQMVTPATGLGNLPVAGIINSASWDGLAPLSSSFATAQPGPAAQVLLWGEGGGRQRVPLLLVQRFGMGYVLQSAMMGTWRWQMYDDKADMTGPGFLETFWLSLVHYLSGDPGGFESRLELPRSSISLGGRMEIWLFRDVASRSSAPPEQIQLKVTTPTGSEETLPARLTQESIGLYQTSYIPNEEGSYRVEFSELDQSVGRSFTVAAGSREDADYTMNRALLQRLASMSGGEMALMDDARAAALRIEFKPRQTLVNVPVFLGRSLWVLALLLTLLCLEWLLRRTAQLP
jgi:hypothetical protein